MTEISYKQWRRLDQYWFVYAKDDGSEGHIQLSACANNFKIHHGGDGTCIGLRYEKDGFGYYELFNVGHTLVKFPLKGTGLLKLLKGKKYDDALRSQYESIEKAFNNVGWKTLEKTN